VASERARPSERHGEPGPGNQPYCDDGAGGRLRSTQEARLAASAALNDQKVGVLRMQSRTLGRSDLDVSVLCFGGNIFGWTTDEQASYAVLDAFMDAGGNFIDSADVYSRWVPGNQGGESEEVLGRWMKARRNRSSVIVATKLGSPMGDDGTNRVSRAGG